MTEWVARDGCRDDGACQLNRHLICQPIYVRFMGEAHLSSGPTDSHHTAQQVVLAFLRDELQPIILNLHALAQRASSLDTGFWESFTQKEIRAAESSYGEAMQRFMAAYKKWYFPDEMFATAGPAYTADTLANYMAMRPALAEHVHEGFRLLEYIDRIISGHKSVAYNRVAIFLSITAITVSVIVALFQI